MSRLPLQPGLLLAVLRLELARGGLDHASLVFELPAEPLFQSVQRDALDAAHGQ